MEFEILENSADFKPSDLDEIMIEVAGIRSKTQPPCRRTRHTGCGEPMITWRSPKRKARPWGCWRRFATATTSLRAIFTA